MSEKKLLIRDSLNKEIPAKKRVSYVCNVSFIGGCGVKLELKDQGFPGFPEQLRKKIEDALVKLGPQVVLIFHKFEDEIKEDKVYLSIYPGPPDKCKRLFFCLVNSQDTSIMLGRFTAFKDISNFKLCGNHDSSTKFQWGLIQEEKRGKFELLPFLEATHFLASIEIRLEKSSL